MPSNSLLHFITKIIKFEGFRATNYHFITENELLIQLENKSGRATCPHCHKITDKVHQSHPYRVRDIPLSTWDVFLLVDRRQFKCKKCNKVFSEEFFNDQATEHLFGEGILPEDFNDDRIGRVMDKLYQFGLRKIFLIIALVALKKSGIDHKYLHLDSTSISLPGDYAIGETVTPENLEPTPIKIVHGYSKDRRLDLKQFLINLIGVSIAF